MRTLLIALIAATALADEAAPISRPSMRQLPEGGSLEKPPSRRQLVDARAALKARFREPLSHTETAAGAMLASDILFQASLDETDRALKWLLLDESRELAAAAGNADAVTRAITVASAVYEFDALDTELRSLVEIPLRALDIMRAKQLAEAAETLALKARTDGRGDLAESATLLAIRAWQRTGNNEAARRAAGK
jgi:hypothetical protein